MASASLSAGVVDQNSAAPELGSLVRMPEDDFRSVTSSSPTTSTIPDSPAHGKKANAQEEQNSDVVQSPPPNALSQTPSPMKNKLPDATSGGLSVAGRKPATPFRRAVSPRTLTTSTTAPKQQLSSAELEMAAIEKKRAEAKELAERNARRMKKSGAAASSKPPDAQVASTPRARTPNARAAAAATPAGAPPSETKSQARATSRTRARTPGARSPRAPAGARATEVKTKLSSAELEMAEIEKRRAEAKHLAEKNARFMAKAHKNATVISPGQIVKNAGPEHTDQRASVVAPPKEAKLETVAADAAPEVVGEASPAPLPASAKDFTAPKETHAQDEVGGGPSPEEVFAAKVEADAVEEARIAALKAGEGEVGPESTEKELNDCGPPDVDGIPVHSEDVPKTAIADNAPEVVGETSPAPFPASANEVSVPSELSAEEPIAANCTVAAFAASPKRVADLNVGEGQVAPESESTQEQMSVAAPSNTEKVGIRSEDAPEKDVAGAAPEVSIDASPAPPSASANEVLASAETKAP